MKKVAIFRLQLFKRSETFITGQAEALQRYQPTYVGRTMFGEAPAHGRVISLAGGSFWETLRFVLLRRSSRLEAQMRALNPDLIHAHFGVDAVYALPLARQLGVPLVTTFHGFDATMTTRTMLVSGKPAFWNYLLLRKVLARRGALFLGVSAFIRQRVLALGFPDKKCVTHFIGMNIPEAKTTQKRDPHLILHVARLTEKKGTTYLLEAMAKVVHHHPEAKLAIIGEGDLQETLENQTKALGLEEHVTFLGARAHAEVLDAMNQCALFCLPSVTAANGDMEGLPTVILEAAARKVPVVGTWHSGIPEAVQEGQTGLLVPEKDSSALAKALLTLLQDEPLRRKMGEAAHAFVARHFNLKTQTALLETLYDSVL